MENEMKATIYMDDAQVLYRAADVVKVDGSIFDLKKHLINGRLYSLVNSVTNEFIPVSDEQHLASAFFTCSLYREISDYDEPEMTDFEIAIDALDTIANPVKKITEHAEKEGWILDGAQAISLSRDHNYLHETARAALIKLGHNR